MYPVKGARDSSPSRSVVSYTVRNSSRRLLVLVRYLNRDPKLQ